MPISYYLACFETNRYVWIGVLDDTTSSTSVDADLVVTDVAVDPSNPRSALVKVFHPEQGAAPEDYLDPLTGVRIAASREEYLRAKWGLEPRQWQSR
ncbi:hypothetical protein PS910_03820 [Pseudomonas fluorescens]|nr:hypothetical protein PS910_03820 [Pseudomonas fluorescens]